MSLFRRKRKQAPGPAPEHEEADSGFGTVGRSPLVFLSFYLDLPLDAGISEGHGFNEIEFSKPALEDWAGFDLQAFLGMPPLPEPAVHPCTSLRFDRVTNEVPPDCERHQGRRPPTPARLRSARRFASVP